MSKGWQVAIICIVLLLGIRLEIAESQPEWSQQEELQSQRFQQPLKEETELQDLQDPLGEESKEPLHYEPEGQILYQSLLPQNASDIINASLIPAVPYGNYFGIDMGDNEICMDELGCFGVDNEFQNILERPINPLPNERHVINTTFLLFTRERPSEMHVLRANNIDTIDRSTFNSTRETKIIVHGFLVSYITGKWMESMKTALLLNGDYNVIIVDWSGGNGIPYSQATANARVVAAEIALLIDYLGKKRDLQPDRVHIIGHSLGAHIAGYTGKRIKEKGRLLGRITGLDPAGPYFQNMPPVVRLDRTDADFVDVIHSDINHFLHLGFGMSEAIGHVDFFPNNGRKQPGCSGKLAKTFVFDGLNEGLRYLMSCDHQRSVDFFLASINLHQCQMLAYECKSWSMYVEGKCIECGPKKDRCALMGLYANEFKQFKNDNKSVTMYTKTTGEEPFCAYIYQVLIQLDNPKGAKEYKGRMTVTLYGQGNFHEQLLGEANEELYPGSQYTYLAISPVDLGVVDKVKFAWKPAVKRIFISQKVYIKNIRITPLYIRDKAERNKGTTWLCGTFSDAVKAGETLSLTSDSRCKD